MGTVQSINPMSDYAASSPQVYSALAYRHAHKAALDADIRQQIAVARAYNLSLSGADVHSIGNRAQYTELMRAVYPPDDMLNILE